MHAAWLVGAVVCGLVAMRAIADGEWWGAFGASAIAAASILQWRRASQTPPDPIPRYAHQADQSSRPDASAQEQTARELSAASDPSYVAPPRAPVLSAEERAAALQREVAHYVRQGWTVAARTPLTASLVYETRIGCLWHLVLTAITAGIWLAIWLIWSAFGTTKVLELEVEPDGQIRYTRGRR